MLRFPLSVLVALNYSHLSSTIEYFSSVRFCFFFLRVFNGYFHFVCQDGIKPMWEDDRNKLGGRWLMTLNKQQRHNDLDRYWMETVTWPLLLWSPPMNRSCCMLLLMDVNCLKKENKNEQCVTLYFAALVFSRRVI